MPANPDDTTEEQHDEFFDELFDDTADEPVDDPVPEKPEPEEPEPEGVDERSRRERFREWRHGRPFIPGLLLMLSGFFIAAPAYLTLQISDLLVMISTVSGVSTLLIGALMFMFGIGAWLQPETTMYVGVLSILLAIVALPTSNLGGFIIGSLLGIIGGALTLAWRPEARSPKRKKSKKHPPKHERRDNAANHAKSVAAIVGGVAVIALSVGETRTVHAQEAPSPGFPAVEELLPRIEVPSLPALPPPPPPYTPPAIPELPTLPAIEDVLPVPPLPGDTDATPAPASEAPAPVATGMSAPAMSTVTADSVTVTGNVRAALGIVEVAGVPQRALILTGDRLVARNLGLQIPGVFSRGSLTTGPVETIVSDGPVQVVATGLTATPAAAGIPTLPVTVDLSGTVGDVLAQLGVPDARPVPEVDVPDMLMNVVSLTNVRMDLVSLTAARMQVPTVNLSAARN